MTLERFDRIGRAARIITARRGKQGTERHLIRTHEQNEKRSHQVSLAPASAEFSRVGGNVGFEACQAVSWASIRPMSASSAEKVARYASGRMRITI